MRDVAMKAGITERAVQHIVAELEEAGYLSRTRDGRNNRYTIHTELPLRHPVERHCSISTLIEMTLRGGNDVTRKSIAGARRPVRGS
jgi:DNA-binding IclR family transcriptional regulator